MVHKEGLEATTSYENLVLIRTLMVGDPFEGGVDCDGLRREGGRD